MFNIKADYNWDYGIFVYPCKQIDKLNYLKIYKSNGPDFYIYPQSYLIDIGLNDGNCAFALEMNDGSYKESYIIGTLALHNKCMTYGLDTNIVYFYNATNALH